MGLVKISDDFSELKYEKKYAVKEKSSGGRLMVTPDKGHVKMTLILLAGENKNHSYSIAYFLLESCQKAWGKYQSAKALSWDELENFCKKYTDYLETDARHNFGIRDNETKDTVIYDNHNVLYVFGNMEEKIEILENNGYKKVDKIVVPKPHSHFFYDENDDNELELIKNNEWIFTPVKIRDDDDEDDDDWDKETAKKSFFDKAFDYLETETL